MYSTRVKTRVFVLEGLNSLATTLYFFYLFFLMRAEFGFGNLGNLTLCAANGLVYMVAAWYAGQFAQRRGYFLTLRWALAVMAASLLVASRMHTVAGLVATLLAWTVGASMSWPVLEALVSEGETAASLPRWLGIYNVVWAGASGAANFVGGALLEKLGPQSTFLLPVAVHLFQLLLLGRLEREVRGATPAGAGVTGPLPAPTRHPGPDTPLPAEVFLKMAWVANPFAYLAMNALIPVIPRLADRFALSPMFAGFFSSVWLFARAGTFLALWLWTGWHYRFRWLIASYVAVAAGFTALLLVAHFWVAVLAQVALGAAVGLIYFSSLFYSMDVGETKGAHGGFHEAAIGAGSFAGPAVGALALRFFPSSPSVNTWAVNLLLAGGLCWLLFLRYRRRTGAGAVG